MEKYTGITRAKMVADTQKYYDENKSSKGAMLHVIFKLANSQIKDVGNYHLAGKCHEKYILGKVDLAEGVDKKFINDHGAFETEILNKSPSYVEFFLGKVFSANDRIKMLTDQYTKNSNFDYDKFHDIVGQFMREKWSDIPDGFSS